MWRPSVVLVILCAGSSIGRATEPPVRPCADSANTQEQIPCGQREVDKADNLLTKIYAVVIRGLESGAVDPMFSYFEDKKRALEDSQRAWTKYRDSQCLAVGASYGAGTGKPIGIGYCLLDLTNERLMFVRSYGQELLFNSVLCRDQKNECTLLRQEP